MTKATRARYTLEFKQEAVWLVEKGPSLAAARSATQLRWLSFGQKVAQIGAGANKQGLGQTAGLQATRLEAGN